MTNMLHARHLDDGPYTTLEVARLAGVTYRQIDHWTRTGLLRHAPTSGGSGCPRAWDRRALLEVIAIGRLRNAGLDIAFLRRLEDPVAVSELILHLSDATHVLGAYLDELVDA